MVDDFFKGIVEDAIRVMRQRNGSGVAYLFTTEQLDYLLKTCSFKVEYRIADGYIAVWKKPGESIGKLSKGKTNRTLPANIEIVAQKVNNGEINIKTACELLGISYKIFLKYRKDRGFFVNGRQENFKKVE